MAISLQVKFPPCIYYKVFTHRPIVDMCANSPKDYAKLATLKGQRGKSQRDNREDLCGWYQRIENNGWRLLSPRVRKSFHLPVLLFYKNTSTACLAMVMRCSCLLTPEAFSELLLLPNNLVSVVFVNLCG